MGGHTSDAMTGIVLGAIVLGSYIDRIGRRKGLIVTLAIMAIGTVTIAVCPTYASHHTAEGLNAQVYNRCIGTRYCSNNCPYKVRRFNFLQYSDEDTESLKGQRNPEVTVRMRGVMEKCNYCLQRIANGRIEADKQDRRIRDGEVVTACQAACPTRAITFGDLNDPASAVNARKASPYDYALLAELNTEPRTTYGTKLVNPNPALKEG